MELVNKTPFLADRFALRDRAGKDLLVVVVKCTYEIRPGMPPVVSEEQAPIQMADMFWGEPGESSIRYESDLAPYKTGTDVVLLGHAYAERGRASRVDVSLRVGGVRKTVCVFGNRQWLTSLAGPEISAPEPFDRLPLVYELAFGGADQTEEGPEQDPRNPVGRGFRAKKSTRDLNGMALPNLEDPTALIGRPSDSPPPACFGFLGRHWHPRREFAGTYDDQWMETRSPFLPEDFNEDYHSGASTGLVARPHLLGHEPVEVFNASQPSPLQFQLPGGRPEVRMLIADHPSSVEVALDTLVIEPDLRRFATVWRGARIVPGELDRVGGIEVRFNGEFHAGA